MTPYDQAHRTQLPLSELRQLVDAGIIQPSYYRLPCACSLLDEPEQLELPLDE